MQRNAVFYAQSIKVVSNSFAILWTVACQGPLSMGFSKQEFWSGLPLSTAGNLPEPGIKFQSPPLTARFFTRVPLGKPMVDWILGQA